MKCLQGDCKNGVSGAADKSKGKTWVGTFKDGQIIDGIMRVLPDIKYKGEFNIPLKDMELRKLIYNWIKITNSPVLLLNLSGNRTTEKNTPMTANGISKYLNKIFKKHFNKTISTSLLRSIMITDKYSNNLSTKEKKKLANDMGHSKGIAENVYNKID